MPGFNLGVLLEPDLSCQPAGSSEEPFQVDFLQIFSLFLQVVVEFQPLCFFPSIVTERANASVLMGVYRG